MEILECAVNGYLFKPRDSFIFLLVRNSITEKMSNLSMI